MNLLNLQESASFMPPDHLKNIFFIVISSQFPYYRDCSLPSAVVVSRMATNVIAEFILLPRHSGLNSCFLHSKPDTYKPFIEDFWCSYSEFVPTMV